jgi:hypothetical protein
VEQVDEHEQLPCCPHLVLVVPEVERLVQCGLPARREAIDLPVEHRFHRRVRQEAHGGSPGEGEGRGCQRQGRGGGVVFFMLAPLPITPLELCTPTAMKAVVVTRRATPRLACLLLSRPSFAKPLLSRRGVAIREAGVKTRARGLASGKERRR